MGPRQSHWPMESRRRRVLIDLKTFHAAAQEKFPFLSTFGFGGPVFLGNRVRFQSNRLVVVVWNTEWDGEVFVAAESGGSLLRAMPDELARLEQLRWWDTTSKSGSAHERTLRSPGPPYNQSALKAAAVAMG